MNVLVLCFDRDTLNYEIFSKGEPSIRQHGRVVGFRTKHAVSDSLQSVLEQMALAREEDAPRLTLDAVALHVAFGGDQFSDPVVATPETIRSLEGMISSAPMHIPPVLELISSCSRSLPDCPVVLFFETAFFTKLPEREHLYAINPNLQAGSGLRRYGYHGLFHEAACVAAIQDSTQPERIISICLEPCSEIAAVVGDVPVMVSGGATPLEGLPGNTSSGEIDSGLLLSLSRMARWGPEQINTLLTQRSGLMGLTGRSITLPEVICSGREDVRLARDVMQYRILQQTGMALVAMNGFDRIVFSGRYAQVGREIGPWLAARLPSPAKSETAPWSCFEQSLMQILATQTPAALFSGPEICNVD